MKETLVTSLGVSVTSLLLCVVSAGFCRCAATLMRKTHLPLNLPHVDEVLAQLSRQEVLAAEDGQCPGRAVPPPVGEQARAAVQVEDGGVPQLRAGVAADDHLQRSRHVSSTITQHAGSGSQCFSSSLLRRSAHCCPRLLDWRHYPIGYFSCAWWDGNTRSPFIIQQIYWINSQTSQWAAGQKQKGSVHIKHLICGHQLVFKSLKRK